MSGRNERRTRRLRGRAWVAGALVLAGGAYFGRGLAFAHTRPAPVFQAAALPDLIVTAQLDQVEWLPASGRQSLPQGPVMWRQAVASATPSDPWSDPEIHQLEESCNQNGVYPSSTEFGQEFSLDRSGWKYSSLDGVQLAAAQSEASPTDVQLRQWGWDAQAPLWALATPKGLSSWLPSGLSWSEQVRAFEVKAQPTRRQAELTVYLNQAPELPEAPSIDSVWAQLPAASATFCLRRELAGALWSCQAGPGQWARKVLATSDHWMGLGVDSEFAPDQLGRQWEQINRAWLPTALWSDRVLSNLSGGQYVELAPTTAGSLFCAGISPNPGTSTMPSESFGVTKEALQKTVGMGRFHWRYAGDLQRVEWLANLDGQKLQFQVRWTACPTLPETAETMLPDVESIYTPRPNVIAGQ